MGPTVAITGSAEPGRRYDPDVRDADQAIVAAEELGAELARHGCRLIVYSASDRFIEVAVVRGYLGSGAAKPGSVHVLGRYGSARDTDFPQMKDHPEVFDLTPEVTQDWEVSYYRSLIAADALLILGGGQSTFVAGLLALSRRIPLVAVASFGGAAEKVWRRFVNEPNHATTGEVVRMCRPWDAGSAVALVDSLVAQHERRLSKESESAAAGRSAARRATAWLLAGAALLLASVATVPLAYAWRPGTAGSVAALVAGPMLAASCGAIMRTAVDERTEWLRTAVLGAAAGAIAFLLFGAAQLAAVPDVLQDEGARRLIFFVLPVGFIAGLTFDAVYRKLRMQDVTSTSAVEQR